MLEWLNVILEIAVEDEYCSKECPYFRDLPAGQRTREEFCTLFQEEVRHDLTDEEYDSGTPMQFRRCPDCMELVEAVDYNKEE
jgi:hypothetical protein